MENHCQYGISVLLWNSNLIMKFQSYFGFPVLLWNSSLIMEFQCDYGIPFLLWNPNVIMEFQSYYGIPVLLWNSNLIMEFQYYYGIPVSLWNSSLIMESQSHYGIYKKTWKWKKATFKTARESLQSKRHCIKVETFRNVLGYVMDGVNCDTASYLVYNSPHSQSYGCGCGPNLSITVL